MVRAIHHRAHIDMLEEFQERDSGWALSFIANPQFDNEYVR